MLKQYSNIFRRLLILTDVILVTLVFFAAYHSVQFTLKQENLNPLFPIRFYYWAIPTVVISWVAMLFALGNYETFRLKKISQILSEIVQSALYSFVLFSACVYLFKIQNVSRLFIATFFFMGLMALCIEKLTLYLILRRLRARGMNFRNILVIGTSSRAVNFVKDLDINKELGLKVIGFVDENPTLKGLTLEGRYILGGLDDIPDILNDRVIDYALFIVPRNSLQKIEPALKYCELVGVNSSVAVDLFDLQFTTPKETSMLGVPMVTFQSTPSTMTALFTKRLVDVIISGVGLIAIAPLYALIAGMIKLTSKGPIHFTQERVGLNGRMFKLYKFRTMCIDAEEKLKDLMAKNQMEGPAFKMENDPRITPIGKFLRKFSLDELPQLWNVFNGDMSLVGPRPPLMREVQQYNNWHKRRLSMRPGITCLWQVSGRNKITSFDEWARLDLKYIDEWSFGLDLKILARTVPAVLSTSGAK